MIQALGKSKKSFSTIFHVVNSSRRVHLELQRSRAPRPAWYSTRSRCGLKPARASIERMAAFISPLPAPIDSASGWLSRTCRSMAAFIALARPRTPLQRLASLFGLRRSVSPMAVRGLADVDFLKAQLPLPETRDELCAEALSGLARVSTAPAFRSLSGLYRNRLRSGVQGKISEMSWLETSWRVFAGALRSNEFSLQIIQGTTPRQARGLFGAP